MWHLVWCLVVPDVPLPSEETDGNHTQTCVSDSDCTTSNSRWLASAEQLHNLFVLLLGMLEANSWQIPQTLYLCAALLFLRAEVMNFFSVNKQKVCQVLSEINVYVSMSGGAVLSIARHWKIYSSTVRINSSAAVFRDGLLESSTCRCHHCEPPPLFTPEPPDPPPQVPPDPGPRPPPNHVILSHCTLVCEQNL